MSDAIVAQSSVVYLTEQQVAEATGLNVWQVRNAVKQGRLPAVETRYAIPPEALEAFAAEHVVRSRSGRPRLKYVFRPDKKRGRR